MTWTDLQSNWAAITPSILTRWPGLNEADVLATEGDQDRFLALLATSRGGDEVAAQMELADWMIGPEPSDAIMHATRDNARISASVHDIAEGEDPLSDDEKFGDDNVGEPPLARAS